VPKIKEIREIDSINYVASLVFNKLYRIMYEASYEWKSFFKSRDNGHIELVVNVLKKHKKPVRPTDVDFRIEIRPKAWFKDSVIILGIQDAYNSNAIEGTLLLPHFREPKWRCFKFDCKYYPHTPDAVAIYPKLRNGVGMDFLKAQNQLALKEIEKLFQSATYF
jgi:hypothetical protein